MGLLPEAVGGDDPVRRQWPDLGLRPAVRVLRIENNTPAALAGIQTGDVILSIGGEPTGNVPMFAAVVAASRGPTEVQIIRDGQTSVVSVDLEPK
jgi:S1-C subfamily serine protease